MTCEMIARMFDSFNSRYFGGELETPQIIITELHNVMGQYRWEKDEDGRITKSQIVISSVFNRDDNSLSDTLLHEMIHQYIIQNGLKDNRTHGRLFKSIMERINTDGHNIRTFGRRKKIVRFNKN